MGQLTISQALKELREVRSREREIYMKLGANERQAVAMRLQMEDFEFYQSGNRFPDQSIVEA